jgi:hypothetical protein
MNLYLYVYKGHTGPRGVAQGTHLVLFLFAVQRNNNFTNIHLHMDVSIDEEGTRFHFFITETKSTVAINELLCLKMQVAQISLFFISYE